MRRILSLFFLIPLLASCYYQGSTTSDAWSLTDRQVDSISFYATHHYTQNYNFLVKADSLLLVVQHPTEYVNSLPVDTLVVYEGERIVVADVTTMPADTVDSIWVKVARDQQTIGWIHERDLLPGTLPDNPISEFIDLFSDVHLLLFLAIIVMAGAFFVIRRLMKWGARIVHFNDIPSFYPTLLCLLTATSAVFYSTIQIAAPESWRHFYYHPTLNPFSVPFHLALFLLSVWALIIAALAAVDDIRRHLSGGEALFYYLGLAGVCAVDYIVFSITTLYYVGYPLLLAYVVVAVLLWYRQRGPLYRCGQCGGLLSQKGVCPHCGAINE